MPVTSELPSLSPATDYDDLVDNLLVEARASSEIVESANKPRHRSLEFRTLSVLIPVFNERWTLQATLNRVLSAPLPLHLEVIVVDDGSTDGSCEVVEQVAKKATKSGSRVRLIRLKERQGRGAAIRRGIAEMEGEVVVVQDPNLEYDPHDFASLLQPILDGEADAVFGSRFSGSRRRVRSFGRSLANQLLTTFANVLNDLNLTDVHTCYKMVRADLLRDVDLKSDGFELDVELTARLAQWGARIFETPVSYRGQRLLRENRPGACDAMKAAWRLIQCRYFDTRFTRHTGMYVLRSVDHAQRYNRWLIRQVKNFMGKRVAEAGSGIGNLSQLLIEREHLKLVDHDPAYVAILKDRFGDFSNVHVGQTDLEQPGFGAEWSKERLDTILCSNVLEHLGPHREILSEFHHALQPGGHCIIVVPAEPKLYTVLDESLGHYRRYRRAELMNLMAAEGFDIVHVQQVCKAGALAWLLNGRALRRRRLTPRQMIWFDRLWPLLRPLDHVLPIPGMSLIVVGRKPVQ